MANAEEYRATFELVDADGDGYISVAEFQNLMRALGEEITEMRAVEVVVSGDRDRDGKISLVEFADYMAAGASPRR